jgi:uncharacterized protein YkwD
MFLRPLFFFFFYFFFLFSDVYSLSDSIKTAILDYHNQLRANVAQGQVGGQPSASNMDIMRWDDALAKVAQDYSEQCVWGHNSARTSQFISYKSLASFEVDSSTTYIGENLAMGTGGSISSDYAKYLIDLWFNEHTLYSYSSKSCRGVCGHYTQMVWANSRYLGCGMTQCSFGYFLVCNYGPGGNNGNYPYESGTSCTSCASDSQSSCTNGLCSGCFSK